MESVTKLITNAKNGDKIVLKKQEYHIYQENCQDLKLVVSNTCFESESPDGDKKTAICVFEKKNIEIDGNGAKIIVHGVITPFVFIKSKNIKLKNLTVEYARPTMNEFEIVESKAGFVKIRIPEKFLYNSDANKLIWLGEYDKNGNRYWELDYKGTDVLSQIYKKKEKKLEMLPRFANDKFPSFPDIKKITEISKGLLEIEFEDKNILLPENSIIQTRNVSRKEIGGAFDGCDNLTFENLTIHNMNGMGLVFQNCKNLTFSGCNFIPNKDSIIVSNADFLHFSGCRGKIKVKDCTAIGAHDDVINVHGTHLAIVEQDKTENSITVRFRNSASWGFNAFETGDKIEIVNSQTLIAYEKAKVKAVEIIDKYTVKLFLYKKLSKPINIEKDVVENVSRTPSLTVDNCHFERISSRAILTTTRKNTVIKNTVFKNMCGPVLYVADDCNFWYESGKSGIVKFIGNTVESCDNGIRGNGENVIQYEPVVIDKTSKTPVHKLLIVKKNRFTSTSKSKHTIKLEYLERAKIQNNYFDRNYEIITDITTRVTDKNNYQAR